MRPIGTPISQRLNAATFCIALGIVGILFLALPKAHFSEEEKRELAALPALEWGSLMSGKLAKGLDDYVADNFIFRLQVTHWAHVIRKFRGQPEDGIELFAATSNKNTTPSGTDENRATNSVQLSPPQQADAVPTPPASSRQEGAPLSQELKPALSPAMTPAIQAPQTTQAEQPHTTTSTASASSEQSDNTPYQNIESLIVYKNRAIQVFGGSAKSIAPFIAIANRYHQELAPDVRIYCMAIPAGSDFFLPRKVNKGIMREKESIDQLHAGLNPGIVKVRAYEALSGKTDEYIQFRTDHHWTGLGAYYAYTAFAEAAGVSALPLSSLVKKEIPNFLGTLYYKTLSKDLASHPDTVEYFKVPFKTDALYFPKGMTHGLPTKLYAENAKGGNSYGVFLGSDFPLMKVVSENKTGKKIVVIKDSYGNAFVPYLSSHYEEVYIIDYRYFQGNIKTLIKNNGIQEVLFAHNTFMLNSQYTASRARGFLDGSNSAP